MRTLQVTLVAIAILLGTLGSTLPAVAAGSGSLDQQLVTAVNQDRVGAGLSALTLDRRLTLVAEARAQYLIDHGFFSHCTGGEADTSCPLSGFDFVPRDQAAGISVQTPGTTVAENLALNTFPTATAAAQTNSAWLASPEHKANIMDSRLAFTGVGAVCCFAGSVGGQQVTAADHATIYVQEFDGGPGTGGRLPVYPRLPDAPWAGCGRRRRLCGQSGLRRQRRRPADDDARSDGLAQSR